MRPSWKRAADFSPAAIGGVAGACYALAGCWLGRQLGLEPLAADQRQVLYAAIGPTGATLLGFCIAGAALLFSAGSGSRVGFLFTLGSFQTSGPRAFRQANLALGLMMAWFLLLLLIDGADRGRVVPQAVGVGLISWAFLALGRLVYLVDQLVRLGVKDLSNQPTAGLAPPFSEPLDDDSGPT